jgi:hypothetical protein
MPSVLDYATDVVRAAIAGDDASRLAGRREVRRQLAQCESTKRKLRILEERARAFDAEADQAANNHREVCEPAQRELAELDEELVNLSADRQPIPERIELRRRELLEVIETANEQLTEAIARINRLRAPLNKQLREVGVEAAQGAHLENKLCQPPLVNEQLWNQRFAAGEISKAAQGVIRACDAHAREATGRAELADKAQDKAQAALYRARIGKWQATREAAAKVVAEFEAKSKQLSQQILSE